MTVLNKESIGVAVSVGNLALSLTQWLVEVGKQTVEVQQAQSDLQRIIRGMVDDEARLRAGITELPEHGITFVVTPLSTELAPEPVEYHLEVVCNLPAGSQENRQYRYNRVDRSFIRWRWP